MARLWALWRSLRKQPLWLQLPLAACLVACSLFAAFLFYAFVVIAIFGI